MYKNRYHNTLFKIITVLLASCVYVVTFGVPDDPVDAKGMLLGDIASDGTQEMYDYVEEHYDDDDFNIMDIRDADGRTIFHRIALLDGMPTTFDYWVLRHARPNFDLMTILNANGRAMLHDVVVYGTIDMLTHLLDNYAGADFDLMAILNANGGAMLHDVVVYGTIDMVTHLLDNYAGADFDLMAILNANERTILDDAADITDGGYIADDDTTGDFSSEDDYSTDNDTAQAILTFRNAINCMDS